MSGAKIVSLALRRALSQTLENWQVQLNTSGAVIALADAAKLGCRVFKPSLRTQRTSFC